MANNLEAPKTGDMYRCTKCSFEVHVTGGCDCKNCTTKLECCGQPLDKVTAPPVQNI
ncbi:hypothetical protein K227x_14640 [Rubripirellula lacrimiformis]|uniref:Desulfoferrodoxin N-terminal domain-containing protein n=1 Tax=Rubripirellula lacrimiformis TaxID=1930273 RepID=A0A517N7H0_9BACT|nr:hypothetical protein K227x_14640 [Rubripirellula lacrimiformis]